MAKKSEPQKTNALADAINFVALADSENCIIRHGRISALGQKISAGAILPDTIACAPDTHRLAAALAKCGLQLSLTLTDDNLSVNSGRLRVAVPVLPLEQVPEALPDLPVGKLDERLKTSLGIVSGLASKVTDTAVQSSVLVMPNTVMATNNHVLIEHAHDCDLPPYLAIPKESLSQLLKVNKKWCKFGYSNSSFTVYFDDESWLKLQLYNVKWPDVYALFDALNISSLQPVHTDFFDAVEALAPFVEADNWVFVGADTMHTTNNKAEYSINIGASEIGFNVDYLKFIKKYAKLWAINTGKTSMYFEGDNLRGLIAHVRQK